MIEHHPHAVLDQRRARMATEGGVGATWPVLTDDQRAIVAANTGLIGFFLKRRRVPEDRWEDAYQDGMLGLIRAAQLYDPSKGYRFSTYARNWILQALTRGHDAFEGRSYRSVRNGIEGAVWHRPASLDAPVDGKEGPIIVDLVVADVDVETEALDGVESPVVTAARSACRDDTDQVIITGTLAGLTLQEMGDRLGVSRELVRRRRERIGSRMRHPAAS